MTILANGLDDRFVTSVDLSEFFIDKSTAQPLAFGQIFFYQDTSRTTPKSVFQLTYNSGTGQYSYTALPNPLTLSATGTFDDGNGVNIPIYYYPLDEFGDQELYYVAAYDSNNLLQFTRDAWPFPNISSGASSIINDAIGLTNMLTNPQFAVVNFTAGSTLTIPYTMGSTNVNIAPGWDLIITATGSGTLTVAQTPVAGNAAYPFNPPFVLTITPGLNIFDGGLRLIQTFNHNPDWAAPQDTGEAGFLSGSIMLGPGTSVLMSYIPSAGNPNQIIIDDENTTGLRAQFNATIQLDAAGNPSDGLTGTDTIEISLDNVSPSEIGNVQIIPLSTDVALTGYDQTPVNRQVDQMFNYYKPLLDYKPISSYLVGWDFPLNPAQFLGASVAAQAVGANKSYYAWDQTILFQTANSGITVSRDTTGALKTLSANALGTQLALVQYIPAPQAIEMLSRKKCVNISANASAETNATVSLWYTKTTLPSTIGSNLSLVLTLDADGYPATRNGTWTQVPRSGFGYSTVTTAARNAAKITIATAPSGAANFNQYPLAGWDMQGDTDINNATFFAIVVGTAALVQNDYILWQSISCQDGDIPAVPAAKTISETLSDCQRYYEMSFPIGTVPAQNLGIGRGQAMATQIGGLNEPQLIYVQYRVGKNQTPVLATYGTRFATAEVTNETIPAGCTSTATTLNNTLSGFTITFNTNNISGASGNNLGVQWTSDSRLGQ